MYVPLFTVRQEDLDLFKLEIFLDFFCDGYTVSPSVDPGIIVQDVCEHITQLQQGWINNGNTRLAVQIIYFLSSLDLQQAF